MKQLLRPYIRRGRTKLKSGRFSDTYFDIKAAMGDPVLFARIVRELAKRVSGDATCIAGSGFGGLPLAAAVAQRLKKPLIMVRDEVKSHGTQQRIEGYRPGRDDRVALIDDVYTRGTCMQRMTRILRGTRAVITGRYVVVDRSRTGRARIVSLLKAEQ